MPLVLEAFLPYRLNRLGAVISQRLKIVYGREYGLTIPEWRVLATLGQFGVLTAKRVGRHSAMHKTKVSRAVRGLEERRWLVRVENGEDRREEFLELSLNGRRAYEAILPKMASFEAALIEKLGPEDAQVVEQGLRLLERALDIGDGSAEAGPPSHPA